MSLIKANAVQIGQSPTATDNFTLAVPSSPDGTIKLARGNAGATTQDVISVDASGNVSFAGAIPAGNISSSTAIATGSTTARSLADRFADVVNVKDFGAIGDGVTDDTAAIQAALDYIKTDGGTLVFPYATYKCNSVLTLQLNSSAPSVRWNIEGEDSTLDFTSITTGDLFTVGATGLAYFPEHGSVRIANLKILGAETGNTTTDTPVSSVVGLFLHFASRVELDNVFVEKCYIGIKTAFVFPLQSVKSSVARNFIGLWHDDASNLQKWDQTSAKECRYGCVIYKSNVYSAAKISVLQHTGLWVEDCSVGVHVDTGASGSGTPIILHLRFNDGFYKGITYDTFRLGIAFDFATPQTRGANRTMQLYDVAIDGGAWAGAAYDADTSAITFSSNQNVREFKGLISVADSSDAIVNAPSTGEILFKDNEATFAQNWTTKYYSGGNVVFTRETGGGLNWGDQSLSAYAETTFVPTIIGTSVAGTGTYSAQLGRATKIGNRVFFDIKLLWTAHTGTGNMQIDGLPYASSSADIQSGVSIGAFSGIALTASNVPLLYVNGSSATTISIVQTPVGGGSFSNVTLDTAGLIYCTGSYEID